MVALAQMSDDVCNTQRRTARVHTKHRTRNTQYHSQNNFIDDDSTPLILLISLCSIFLQKRKYK
jgi:hypothetical protein